MTTDEGEHINFYQEELKVCPTKPVPLISICCLLTRVFVTTCCAQVGTQLDGEMDYALLIWPLIINHK